MLLLMFELIIFHRLNNEKISKYKDMIYRQMLESLKNDFKHKHKKDLKTQKYRWIVIKMSKNVCSLHVSTERI